MGRDSIERIDRAVDRLDRALRVAGFDGFAAPADHVQSLADVEREIAPYGLPPDLRRLWERVDFWSVRVHGSSVPDPLDPKSALGTHRLNLAEFPLMFGPPLLFPIARISGDQWSVELTSRWSSGGTVFSYETGGDVLRIEYASVTDLLEVYAELIEEGRFERREGGYGFLGYEDERAKQEARLRTAPADPLYGDVREIGLDPGDWPSHWLESAGLDIRDREPLGATHTIAGLVEASRDGSVKARIRGDVVRAAGSSSGVLVLVSDGNDSLAVFCPPLATTWGLSVRRRYEFEVSVSEPVSPPVELDDAAFAAPDGPYLRMFEGHHPGAVAIRVRPLD